MLHDAFLAGGAFVKVPRGVVVERPIVVLHWSEGDGLASFPHTLVVAEDGAEVTVFDRYGSTDTGAGSTGHLVDAVVELVVGDNAHVRYLSVQEHGPRTWQIALQRAHIGRDATLKSSVVALGGAYARLRSESLLAGSGAESDLTAVYFGDGNQMLDFRTLQDHDAPNTRSDLLFKGAVEDTAQSVYSGLIRIRPEAQKSVALQTNRNLVLTEGAEAKSVPNLEIEADDVKCSHASTVGPVDDDQLYYLATRGVAARGGRASHRARASSTTSSTACRCRRSLPRCGAAWSRSSSTVTRSRGPVSDVRICAVERREAGHRGALRRRRPPPLRRQHRGRRST